MRTEDKFSREFFPVGKNALTGSLGGDTFIISSRALVPQGKTVYFPYPFLLPSHAPQTARLLIGNRTSTDGYLASEQRRDEIRPSCHEKAWRTTSLFRGFNENNDATRRCFCFGSLFLSRGLPSVNVDALGISIFHFHPIF